MTCSGKKSKTVLPDNTCILFFTRTAREAFGGRESRYEVDLIKVINAVISLCKFFRGKMIWKEGKGEGRVKEGLKREKKNDKVIK